MKANVLLGLSLLFFIVACTEKNDGDSPKIPDPPDYFPMTPGSFWVYNCYEIDSLGNESLFIENDTARVIGDTLINGNTYRIFSDRRYITGSPFENFFYRDSLGYIVNENGDIKFARDNLQDTLQAYYHMGDSTIFVFTRMSDYQGEVVLPGGAYDSLMNHVMYITEEPSSHLIRTLDCLYAPNVGRVLRQSLYVTFYKSQKIYYEQRLVEYYIAPKIE